MNIEDRAFEIHCISSETYTEKKIPIYYKIEAPTGEMALEHFYYWESERDEDIRLGLIEPDSYKIVKIKGYDKDAPFKHFYCPICEEYHEKTLTTKGDYKAIWWCQMPINVQEHLEV